MSDSESQIELDDNEIGLGEEDKGKVQSNQTDWYKGEKGRTDRVAFVYFNSHEQSQLRKAVLAKPDLTPAQKKDLVEKVRVAVATKLNKSADQLDQVDLLDLSEARFRTASGYYKKDVGYVAAPKGPISTEDQKVFAKLGEKKDYVISLLLIYPTDRDGEIDKEALARKWQIKPWRFSPDKYEVLRKINRGLLESSTSLSGIDLHMSCSDTQFQKITITQAGPALYSKNEQFKRKILEKAVTFYKKMSPFRELSVDEIREKLGLMPGGGGTAAPGSDISGEDFSNILGNV
jgi:hypothetical protein